MSKTKTAKSPSPDKPNDPARVFAGQFFFLGLHAATDTSPKGRLVLRESLEVYASMVNDPGFPRQEPS